MLKALVLFAFLSGTSAFADCYQSIVQTDGRNIIPTAKQLACTVDKDEFPAAIRVLCSPDVSDLSANYKIHLDYQAKFQDAFKMFQSSQGVQRATAQTDMNRIRRNWELFGHRNEIDSALAILDSLSSLNCN